MDDEVAYAGWLKVCRRKHHDQTYDILEDHDAVAAIIVNERDDILLVKQFRPALMQETLEIPSGTIDNVHERDLECLLRELKEETRLDIHPEEARHVLSYKPSVGFSNALMKIYHVRIAGNDSNPWPVEDDNVYEVVWLSLEDLEQRIAAGDILDVKTIVACLLIRNCFTTGAKPVST